MSPATMREPEDRVSYALRLTLYATCIVVPFIAVITGALDGAGAVTAATALLGAAGGAVAMSQARRESTTADAAHRHGAATGPTADRGPGGRHVSNDPDERR